ncbi:hypothetical protein B5E41_12195 [Rhizobium esperanzae]|uniref:Peptidase M41 domain-containing protein n=1 Tax=Rhizobium esperanzae TaxID=1967781 RepID=A0A246DW29_9HYPH|nr:hypothetical protein [Rhizobium esperanzae]OWO94519.1 hypothetical protein B5E41_12195 [Rhizobium esperanzae]
MVELKACDIVKSGTISDAALHEAGHCMAALRYGIGVLRVSLDECEIEPAGDFIEQGRHHGSLAVGYAVIALAGQAAAPKTGMSVSDQLLLANACFLGSFADCPAEMSRAFSVLAERFVLDHRVEIEKLAGILDKRRCISGTELGEIFGSIGQ